MPKNSTPTPTATAPALSEATLEARLAIVSNNGFSVEDNTTAEPVADRTVEESETELLGGLVQVNYL